MKRFVTLMMMLPLMFLTLNAQDTTAAAKDTIKEIEEQIEVVIAPDKGKDSTIVRFKGMKIIVLNDGEGENETIIVDHEMDEDSVEYDFDFGDKEDKYISHWSGVRLGVNGYLHKNGLPLPATHDFLELDYAKSISWDLNLIEKDFRLYKQHVELVTGLGLHFANYSFKSKFTTLQNNDPLTAVVDSTRTLGKNRLKATYVTAPLMLGFSTGKIQKKSLRFAFGGQVSWRIGSKLKQEYNVAGETFKPRVRSDFDLTPFLFHGVATVGYGPVNVFACYGLNDLFEKNKTLALTPFDVGLQLMF